MSSPGCTPSQTVGPFLHLALDWDDGPTVVADGISGAFWVRGRVVDGAGDPVVDALVETWQADPDGRFDHPDDAGGGASGWWRHGFRGFGRCATNTDGIWAVRTVKPSSVTTLEGVAQAPHLAVSVFARGLLDRVVTRCYFSDEAVANAADPLLASLPADRRATLVASAIADGYRFDIVLQGVAETVFLDV